MIRVYELEMDETNAEELAKHGISEARVLSVLEGRPQFFRNKRGRAATHVMIGPDSSGIILAIPIKPTHIPGRWRPITGWEVTKQRRRR